MSEQTDAQLNLLKEARENGTLNDAVYALFEDNKSEDSDLSSLLNLGIDALLLFLVLIPIPDEVKSHIRGFLKEQKKKAGETDT